MLDSGSCIPGPQDAIVAHEGLAWDSLLYMLRNPGGNCYLGGGRSNLPCLFRTTSFAGNMN